MSRNKDLSKEYAEKLKEYEEKLIFSTNFSMLETLCLEEHKMLIEGYKEANFCDDKVLKELEIADLSDYFVLERKHGGTNF